MGSVLEQGRVYVPESGEVIDVSAVDYTPDAPFVLLVGTAGTVYVDFYNVGTNVPLKVSAGIYPLKLTKIYKLNTTASNLVALRT